MSRIRFKLLNQFNVVVVFMQETDLIVDLVSCFVSLKHKLGQLKIAL